MNHIYDINGDYYPCNSNKVTKFKNSRSNNRIVEKFAVNIGNKTTTTDNTLVKNATNIEKDINQSSVIAGVSKMLGAVLNEVANENNAELSQMIALANEISITNVEAGGDFVMAGVNQEATSDTDTNIKASQKIQNKIATEISRKLSNKVENIIDTLKSKDISNEEEGNSSSSIGGTITALGTKAMDTAGEILSVGIGNSTNKTTNNTQITELSDKLKLDKSFKIKKDNSISDTIGNKLSSKNMAKCAKDTKQANKFKLDKIKVGGSVKLGNLTQRASVKAVLSCAFDQTVLNDISTKVISDLDENIKNMQKSADIYAEKNKSVSTSGDVYAAGVAGKAILQGVGEAAVGVGSGVSTAAEGVGKGVSTAAEGVGAGIGAAMSGLVMPLIAGAIAMVIFGVVYTMVKKGGMPSMEGDDE
jgi:hypothetical protein